MTEHGVLPGLWPIHGDGVLARQGDLVLLIHPAGGAFTDKLLDRLAEAARTGEDGLRFTDRLSAEFDADAAAADTAAAQQGPAVVAFGPAGGGTALAVYGTGWAEVTTAHGLQRLTAGEPYGRLRCVMPSTLIMVHAGVQPVSGEAETDPYMRLADGMVRAVALLYAPAEVSADAANRARAAALAQGPALAQDHAPGRDRAADIGLLAPVVAEQLQTARAEPEPAPEPGPEPEPAPQPVPDPVLDEAPALYADQLQEPEPEYHATRVEPSVPMPPSAPPLAADPYAPPGADQYAPPPRAAEPYGPPRAADPYGPPGTAADLYAPPGADQYAPPPRAADPYASPAPPLAADPYAPAAPDPYAPAPPDPYAPAGPDPYAPAGPGLAGGPPDAASPQDFISISFVSPDLGGVASQRDPLPLGAEPPEAKDLGLVEMPSAMVEGVYCQNGHFNDPEARYCAVCGISMGQAKNRQKGTRPPLGVLVLGDGSVCQLDADYVIGREPTLDSTVAEGRARPLRLMGASGVVSRIHARVDLDGWQVFLTDLNSANGTQVLLPGERNPTNLQPGIRIPLVAGAQIRLGGEYALQYDSHRHQ